MNRNCIASLLAAALVGATLVTAGVATADSDHDSYRDDDRPGKDWLSVTELAQTLEQRGYTPYEVEIDDGAYEVRMVDDQGMMIETYVDPTSGEPLQRRWDD
jgi:uncharacterized membrane protein YkoI